jgi:hypothetical protein
VQVIAIPRNGRLTALNAVVPLQLIAHGLSVARGYHPDTAPVGEEPRFIPGFLTSTAARA